MTAAPAHVLPAPAKINLTLAIGSRRPDGFHALDSILLRLALADRLTVRAAGGPPSDDPAADHLIVDGPEPCPVPGNLVLRAAAALRTHVRRALPPLAFALHKVVPLAAGRGGGSSDAAAALRLAAGAWRLELDDGTLLALAATLGSDVPFFALGAPAARATGRGEWLEPLPAPIGRLACLLAVEREGVSTAAVYEAFDAAARPSTTASPAAAATTRVANALGRGLKSRQLVDGAGELRGANDLWAPLVGLRPDLAQRRAALEQHFGRPWLLSGSGPTLFALYASEAEARRAIDEAGPWPDASDAIRLLVTAVATGGRP